VFKRSIALFFLITTVGLGVVTSSIVTPPAPTLRAGASGPVLALGTGDTATPARPGGASWQADRLAVHTPPPPPRPAVDTRVARVLAYARAQLGEWYRWGAAGPDRWDCSGLAMRAYGSVGIRLPHWSGGRVGVVSRASMLGYGTRVSRANLRPGDLVWPIRGHVQIYLGNGMVIESPHSGARVRIVRMWGFWTARRLIA
jgi:cell wall-associated NlpC family hydrolase